MTGAAVGRTVLEGLRVPDALSARVPAEQRGAGRDDVRLLVSRGTEVSHHAFRDLAGQLRAGDVLVVNTSRIFDTNTWLLPEPQRLSNGYRVYSVRDAVLLARIRRLSE
ncbi:S-adenosylmethionine:tRNA ribosyltransferase-isomerase, partial [Streptomyces niveus]|uniref:S-adenosylmethionine:tRNA ribosyltransferase-isomerase n=1 Tax=Streptomyces niveus TaxID=193462 RepID=UPI00341DB201